MPDGRFVSYAQNGEDVVLHRALSHVERGRYVEVGSNDPVVDSVSAPFYARGWSGITIEPMRSYADRHRDERPRDILIEAAIADESSGTVVLHQIDGTGLSTLVDDVGRYHQESGWSVSEVEVPARRLDEVLESVGWDDLDINFMLVDTEGAEDAVLQTVDLRRWRPWILVVEATEPRSTVASYESWEPLVLTAGYTFCLFDGLSRFYVANEQHEALAGKLSYPACVHDNYVTRAELELHQSIAGLNEELARQRSLRESEVALAQEATRKALAAVVTWREKALQTWADATAPLSAEATEELLYLRGHAHSLFTQLNDAQANIDALEGTLSWRVTAPLRKVRRLRSRQMA